MGFLLFNVDNVAFLSLAVQPSSNRLGNNLSMAASGRAKAAQRYLALRSGNLVDVGDRSRYHRVVLSYALLKPLPVGGNYSVSVAFFAQGKGVA